MIMSMSRPRSASVCMSVSVPMLHLYLYLSLGYTLGPLSRQRVIAVAKNYFLMFSVGTNDYCHRLEQPLCEASRAQALLKKSHIHRA